MPDALLFAGNARRFAEQAWDLRCYLKYGCWMKPGRVVAKETAYQPDGRIPELITRAVAQKTSAPLLLHFMGHGGSKGWAIDDVRLLPYLDLAAMLKYRRRPITVVIDACHAMSLVDCLEGIAAIERLRADTPKHAPFEKVAVIGACGKDALTRGDFTPKLIEAWKAKEPERIPAELRWGASHDYHYFPRPVPTPELAELFTERVAEGVAS